MLSVLNFQENEEICFYILFLDEHLSQRWTFDFQQSHLEGTEEEFLAFQMDDVSQTLRLNNTYPYEGCTHFLNTFGCNNHGGSSFQELKFSSLFQAEPVYPDRLLGAGLALEA